METENDIFVEKLSKSFRVALPAKNMSEQLFRKYKTVQALQEVSFSVKRGELLGYIGPNGAGKSTTIKILTGILTPSSGTASVLGFTPWKNRYEYTYNIGVVFGQKSLLWWDIPAIDSFRLYKEVYEMEKAEFEERLAFLSELFNVKQFASQPVRKLSLGQRMRCELIASLLHKPKVLFLDEPTIGLDVVAKERMRSAIKQLNRKEKITTILTTHDMNDIEELASKIIVLDDGKIIFEGRISTLKKNYIMENVLSFELDEVIDKNIFAELTSRTKTVLQEGNLFKLKFSLAELNPKQVSDLLFNSAKVSHFEIREPNLEAIIREIYEKHSP